MKPVATAAPIGGTPYSMARFCRAGPSCAVKREITENLEDVAAGAGDHKRDYLEERGISRGNIEIVDVDARSIG